MTQYDNTNRFALFRNDRRENDKHPEYTGTLNVDGVEYWISAWIKEGQRGKFFSGSVKPKENNMAKVRDQLQGSAPPIDDDIPF